MIINALKYQSARCSSVEITENKNILLFSLLIKGVKIQTYENRHFRYQRDKKKIKTPHFMRNNKNTLQGIEGLEIKDIIK